MAKKISISTKRLQIDKANAKVVGLIAVASFLVVFSLVASKALMGQQAYLSRVISAKEKAVKQLKSNIDATSSLVTAYSGFVSTPENVLGGNPKGTADNDGDNAKIILDALPSKYDFPALATTLEKLLTDRNYNIESITGTDDEINQQTNTVSGAEPVEIPFQISFRGNYPSMQPLVETLEHSIRPIQVQKMSFTANASGVTATIDAKTFYGPEKTLTINTKEIK